MQTHRHEPFHACSVPNEPPHVRTWGGWDSGNIAVDFRNGAGVMTTFYGAPADVVTLLLTAAAAVVDASPPWRADA